MNFLEFLGLKKVMDDTDTKNAIKLPVDYVTPVQEPESEEHFRVGTTTDGGTTLTLMSSRNSMTLTMTPEYCEKLIRMLRATYTNEQA